MQARYYDPTAKSNETFNDGLDFDDSDIEAELWGDAAQQLTDAAESIAEGIIEHTTDPEKLNAGAQILAAGSMQSIDAKQAGLSRALGAGAIYRAVLPLFYPMTLQKM